MKTSVIQRARAMPVQVPAKPNSLNSEGILDEEIEFARKYKTGNRWTDFPLETKWIIEIENSDGLTGVGETYRSVKGESIKAALQALVRSDVLRMNWHAMPTSDLRAYDAIESAVLDLAGKILRIPVYQLLGGAYRDRVECFGWTGRRTPQDAAQKAYEAMQRGHRAFKFKCSDSDPVRLWIDEIRARCGTKMRVLLDPNQRWRDVQTTLRLMEGVPPDSMIGLEDPVDRQNYAAFRELKERLGIPIYVHISLPYLHQGQRAEDVISCLREKCADGFNFNGPMFGFVKLAEIAALDGLTCWHGSEVDLGILEASALHACAAAPNCTLPCDLFGELVRVDDLITEPLKFEQGCAIVPQGAGLGVELDRDAIKRFIAGQVIEV